MAREVLSEGHDGNGASPTPRWKVGVACAGQGPSLPFLAGVGACRGDAEILQAGTPIQPQLTPLLKAGSFLPKQDLQRSSVGRSQVWTNLLRAPRLSAWR